MDQIASVDVLHHSRQKLAAEMRLAHMLSILSLLLLKEGVTVGDQGFPQVLLVKLELIIRRTSIRPKRSAQSLKLSPHLHTRHLVLFATTTPVGCFSLHLGCDQTEPMNKAGMQCLFV
jgi:hypothetical protein